MVPNMWPVCSSKWILNVVSLTLKNIFIIYNVFVYVTNTNAASNVMLLWTFYLSLTNKNVTIFTLAYRAERARSRLSELPYTCHQIFDLRRSNYPVNKTPVC